MDPETGRPLKRFKHQSYQTSLKNVHLPPASVQSRLDEEIPDSESHFGRALDHWRQLNLSPAFLRFAAQIHNLSANVPLLLHHSEEIVRLWMEATNTADDDALRALLDLVQNLVHDLRESLLPSYTPLLETLLGPLTRSHSAETLTVLLTTLSLFFKQFLKATIGVLESTWSILKSTLVKCNSEVQRALAEVWAIVLRRCKGEMRKTAVAAIMKEIDAITDSGTWMFVFAFKTVNHTLHACTPILFEELLSVHLSPNHSACTETLLRRVITALVHHCETPEQFWPISDLLVSRFMMATVEEQSSIMILLSTACSVRRGSRMSKQQIPKVLTHLTQKMHLCAQKEVVLSLGSAALLASDISVWMGPGRKFIEASWEDPILGLKLSGTLSDLDWAGWRLISLPFTLKHTMQLIDTNTLPTLTLLASLARAGRLCDVDERWLCQVAASIQVRLDAWNMGEPDLQELASLLTISSFIPSSASGLWRIGVLTLDAVEPENQEANLQEPLTARVFGACARALGETPSQEWPQQAEIIKWVTCAVKKWAGCQCVLAGLVAISRQHTPSTRIALADVYPYLQGSILSHSHTLRLDALRLLHSSLIEPNQCDHILRRCLEGEESTLDVQGARERILKITGTSQVVKDEDEAGADIAARWLIAQLKVNLRPLWLPAIKALAVLSQRFGELVWNLIFTELETIIRGDLVQDTKLLDTSDETDFKMEAERSWRDPSAAKLRSIVRTWLGGGPVTMDIFKTQCERLDATNYENQLLHALGEITSLTQRHNAELVRLFLSFGSPGLPSKPPRTKLSNWLILLSKLENPKAIHQTSALQKLYLSLLSHPDRTLQSLALTCILNYKSPRLTPYETHLRSLLDDTRWREELTSFDLATIEEEDRCETVDVLIRLFFGLMVERHGRTKGADRRASLLCALAGCNEKELRLLVDLMLEPFSMSSSSLEFPDNLLSGTTEKQQVGFMNLLGDVMKRMGSRIVPYWPSLLSTTIQIVARAQTKLAASSDIVEPLETEVIEKDAEIAVDDELSQHTSSNTRSARTLRQLGIKRFTDFFRCDVTFDFQTYLPSAFAAFISPRLASMERENTQSPSALLELFHLWSSQRDFVSFLIAYDSRVLPKTFACLQAVHVKPIVVSRVFDTIQHILAWSVDDKDVMERVFKPHISPLLDALAIEIPDICGSRSNLMHRQVDILSQVAQFASTEVQARHILQHFLPFLKRPSKIIPEKTKVHLLKIIQDIIPQVTDFRDQSSVIYTQTYDLLSKLFQTLRSKPGRVALLQTLDQLSTVVTSLRRVYGLLMSLNAFSTERVDEPDFNLRLQAFTELNGVTYDQLCPHEWQPVLYNMLQFIQDPDELVIRTNAAYSLKRFLDILTSQGNPEIETLFTRTLFPALKNGLLSKVELVRNEVLGVLAYSVSKCEMISSLSELRPLLANGDKEADFFNNLHHIQIHRRTRALRRLVEHVETGSVRSVTIAEMFIPLIGHFIFNAPTMDHILVDVAISTTGSLARHLNWGAYNALVRQYMALVKGKTPAERACVRTLVAVLENFHFPMDEMALEDKIPVDAIQLDSVESSLLVDMGNLPETDSKGGTTSRIVDAVSTRLLPSLLQHLERRDENEDTLRIPVSIGIARIACHLPRALRESQISRLLTVLCQVFRSKSQDTRALVRDSLCKIAVIIGPSYLAQIITELRAALLQGPHLHILATVAHALLVQITSPDVVSSFNDLDALAVDVAHVSAEVIFGQSSQNVCSEGFRTTTLEVRASSSKGLDAFAILAKHVTSSRISAILTPIKGIMHETGASKTLQLVDDVLRRISGGLNANVHLTPPELLSLCYTLIQQNARFLKEAPRISHGRGRTKGDFAIQVKRRLDRDQDYFAQNSSRFVTFGLDLFNTAFRRGRFDVKDAHVVSRLESMVPLIGNSLYSQDVSVVVQGLKATASIVKCPLTTVEKSLPVFVRQTLDIVKQAGNTESEVVQAAFRTLAVIIRDCATSQVKEQDLVFLLEVLIPDLEEPNRQAAVFGLLRAIVSRKFVVAEMYDIMDKVAEVMVSSQATQVQELCRAVLLQFLLEYPQGKGRLRNQMTFLAQNLSYVFESGRRSVMELLNVILNKFDPSLLREYADLFFVALVMVISNDDSTKCREMAAELIKLLFSHLDVDHRRITVSHLHTWSSEKVQLHLSRVSAQVYGLVVDTLQQEVDPYLSGILEDMNAAIRRSAMELQQLELNIHGPHGMEIDVEWQLPYHALNVINKVLRVRPELTKEEGKVEWSTIRSHLLFPHAWVRNVSSRLIGILFNTTAPAFPDPTLPDDNLLSLPSLVEMASGSCLQLKSDSLDDSLSLQVVKNLFYIGRCFCAVSNDGPPHEKTEDLFNRFDPEMDPESQIKKLENVYSSPLPWLFSKLSYQARSAWLARRNQPTGKHNWSEQPLAVFRWFAAMASHMDPALLQTYLVHILNPVYRVLDDDTIHDSLMGDLRTLAQELLDLVQIRVGSTKFSEVYNQIKQGIMAVRRERKNEKNVQAISDPQASARRKIQRNQAKKDNRTRRTRMFAEGKIRNNHAKRRVKRE